MQDLRNLKRVPLVALLLIGLAILPSLYAWFNLGASWDPYSNTEDIKIAIVNEDMGAEIEGEEVNLGENLEENLKENEAMGWVFTDREKAEKGIRHGDYYAGIFIESDFSQELSRIVDGEPVQTSVEYQVNQKKNAIAPKMTSAGASTIVNEINNQFVDEVSKTLFAEFDKLGLKIEEELPTIRRIKNALYELNEKMPEIVEIGEYIEGIDNDWETIDEQVDHFLAIREYIPQINEGADQVLALQQHIPRIYELSDHIDEVQETIPTLERAVESFDKIGPMFDEADQFLNESQEQIAETREQISHISTRLHNANDQVSTIEDNIGEFQQVIAEAELDAAPFVQSFQSQLVRMDQTMADLQALLQQITADESVSEHGDELQKVQQEIAKHRLYLESNRQVYQKLQDISGDSSLSGLLNEMDAANASLETMQGSVEQVHSSGVLEEDLSNTIENNVATTQQHTQALSEWLAANGESSLNSSFGAIKDTVASADFNMDQLHEINDTLQDLLGEADSVLAQVNQDIATLREEMPGVKDRWLEINGKVQESFPKMVDALNTFDQFIENDLPNVEEKVNQLAAFIEEELPGIEETYNDVADQVEEKMPAVESAIHELAAFSRDKLPEIKNEVSEASDKVHTIDANNQLSDLISLLRNDLADENEFFATPVQLVEKDIFPVPNYGSANAPFYTALSLWVGALLLSNLLSANVHQLDYREDYTLRQVYFGRMILFLIIGVLQALIVSIGNLTILKMYASNAAMFILFSVLIAVVFMVIVYTFASVLGNIGKALMIILLVLQISSGGGTFPIEVAPPFFQAIHPFIPFSYAIDLLREAVAGIVPAIVWYNILMLMVFLAIAILIGVVLKPILASRIEKTVEKSKDSRLID